MTGFDGLAPCVHCGFCLPACPTYAVTGDEADGPRGRIVLMQQLASGGIAPADPSVRHHLDRCLGCRACEPVCPSGVAYGPALDAARAVLHPHRTPSLLTRAVLRVVASPGLRAPLLGLARLLRPAARHLTGWSPVGFAMGMLAGTEGGMEAATAASGPGGALESRDGGTRGSGSPEEGPEANRQAVVFLGCVQRELFGHVNGAAGRTLAANGYRLAEAPDQGCCGALHAHAGELDRARELARANVRAFARAPDAVVAVTAAGCGAMLREYGQLLAGDPLAQEAAAFAARVRDVTELLAAAGPGTGAPLQLTVAYDPPCHLAHAQGVTDPPLAVLGAIPGLRLVAHEEADACCGSAGLYSLVQRDLSRAVLERKLAALAAAAPQVIATGNPGCAMQIAAGLRAGGTRTPVVHPVELLDASYARAGRYRDRHVDSADA